MLIAVIVLAASIPAAWLEWPNDLQPANNGQPLAIDNVNLVTMADEQVLVDRQLFIRNGVIERIGVAGTTVSDDYRRIDAKGAYLMPGLFDMHVHAMDRKNLVLSLAYGVTSVRNMGGYPMHLPLEAGTGRRPVVGQQPIQRDADDEWQGKCQSARA